MADIVNIDTFKAAAGRPSDGTADNPAVAEMVRDMYKLCLSMTSMTEAMPTLLMMERCLRKNSIRNPGLLELPDKVSEYFEALNHPQPSNLFEGCNFSTTGDLVNGNKSVGNEVQRVEQGATGVSINNEKE